MGGRHDHRLVPTALPQTRGLLNSAYTREPATVASATLQSACEPGPVTLPTGRVVWSTGKVLIGLRYARSPASHTRDADWLQDLLRKGVA